MCGVEEGLQVAVPGDAGSLMMNYDQIRSLVQNGHIVGSHTLTHPNMAHITEDEAKVDDKRRVTQAGDNPLSLKLIRPTKTAEGLRWNLKCAFAGRAM